MSRSDATGRQHPTAARERKPLPDALEPTLDPVDEALSESFPASDPPSWTAIVGIGAPRRTADLPTAADTAIRKGRDTPSTRRQAR
jgi:hypothetical protein